MTDAEAEAMAHHAAYWTDQLERGPSAKDGPIARLGQRFRARNPAANP